MVDTAQTDTARMSQLRGALERELGPDEDVLWHGWHLGRIDPRDFMIYVFAVPWTAFSIAWTGIAAMAIAGSGEDGPGLIGWAFPLFGLFFGAMSATYGMPMVVELGIALDVLIGVLILGVFMFQIREQFDSLDIRHLEKLKED